MSFDRLIRFVDGEGRTSYGDLAKPLAAKEIIGIQVNVVVGNLQYGFTRTNEKRTVAKVRIPDAPSVLCAGLNYKLHSNETNFVIPTKPVIFMRQLKGSPVLSTTLSPTMMRSRCWITKAS
ncbi:Fumarylacetoacetate hydrolase domain-containing protein 2-like protein [Colletotrichum fructicola]|nr:Fumarylacetoacetate hydrolase domain-containing protein 2-like protein [Colletotrichum fructicola]